MKHPHLCGRTDRRIFQADRQEADGIIEAHGDAVRPPLKLRARPFEAMVAVTEAPRRKAFPFHVLFAVGSRGDDVLRFGALEEHALESGQARRVQVFDDFHHGGGIETANRT